MKTLRLGTSQVSNRKSAKVTGTMGELSRIIENMTIKLEASGTRGKFVLDWRMSRLVAEFAAG